MKVVAVDPGRTSGIAVYDDGTVRLLTATYPSNLLALLRSVCVGADLLVVERPFITLAVNPVVFKAFGVAEALAADIGLPVSLQEPIVKELVRRRYNVPGAGHRKDAAAHLIYSLEMEGGRDERCRDFLSGLQSAAPSGGAA